LISEADEEEVQIPSAEEPPTERRPLDMDQYLISVVDISENSHHTDQNDSKGICVVDESV